MVFLIASKISMEFSAVKEKSAVARAGVAPAGPRPYKTLRWHRLSSLGRIAAPPGKLVTREKKLWIINNFSKRAVLAAFSC